MLDLHADQRLSVRLLDEIRHRRAEAIAIRPRSCSQATVVTGPELHRRHSVARILSAVDMGNLNTSRSPIHRGRDVGGGELSVKIDIGRDDLGGICKTLELQDVAFGISSETVASGPQIWHVTNTGEQPRQMVLFKTPREFTPEDFATFFAGMQSGTPSPEFMSMIWVAYTAVASPGHGTYLELDLEPGIYTATSWVIDPETQMPALLLGMVTSFTVE